MSGVTAATALALTLSGALANDRQIGVDPMLSVHWSTLTGGPPAQPQIGQHMMVGFWQRASGAKQGVGSINTGVVEFQLPENPPTRIRSATLQFRARASQCGGNEPVVFEVFGYPGNGKADPSDATTGMHLGRITANCSDNPAFTQPIDATGLVRSLSVPSGLRFLGVNVRKVNHRALPSFFGFSSAKLTIVVADQDVPYTAAPVAMGTADPAPTATGTPGSATQFDPAKLIGGLAGAAAGAIMRGGSGSRTQTANEAMGAVQNATTSVPSAPASDPTMTGGNPMPSGTPPTSGAPADAPVQVATMPAAAAAPAAAVAGPGAAAAVNVDIVGIRLGMSLGEVKQKIAAHSTALRIDEHRGIVNNVSTTDYMSWLIARAPRGAPWGSADAIGVHFPPPPNQHRAIFVERFTGFQRGEFPLYETLRAALLRKYGQPSFEREGEMMWTFNATGTQIVDKSVHQRCGRFPPTDPPARGQNVLFNGYKTAGCGTTVFVRYERATGPSERDLLHWVSVSLIDDSQFEEMRQATARFATQATRDSASRVGAPKL
jgi:hypothetical protein